MTGSDDAGDPVGPDAGVRTLVERGLDAPGLRALDVLPAAVLIVDPADTIRAWNRAAEALFDLPAAEALGHKLRDLDVSYRVEGLRARIEDTKTRRAPTRLEDVTFTRRSGEPVHADISVLPFLEARRLGGVLVFAVEATERTRLREQVTRLTEQYAAALEALRSANEEMETINGELQATNEDLAAALEMLRAANEELETTVEQLRVANAELSALNAELGGRGTEP